MKKPTNKRDESLASRSITVPKARRGVKYYVRRAVKGISYLFLFLSASYGLRQMLVAVDERLAFVLVGTIILLLIWVIAE